VFSAADRKGSHGTGDKWFSVTGTVSVADPDVWDRIRILALIHDPVPTYLVCVNAMNTTGKPVV
jgi:hypothetical protein